MKKSFPGNIVSAVRKAMIIGIKIGRQPHRVIGVWAVVVSNRVFIRSWSLKEQGWYMTARKERVGELHLGSRRFRIRPVFVRSERMKDAVSAAYRDKYHTPGSLRYVRDLSRSKSRNTTTELVPTVTKKL